MATFSLGDALLVTALEVRADRMLAIAVFVFVSWSSSLARFAPVVSDMYPIASMRSVLSWAMNAATGSPMVFFTVLALARVNTSLAELPMAKA